MPVIKVADIAYVRLRAPDLERARTFLLDFGLIVSARTPAALYMRGTGGAHHLHVTELGEPGFVGLGFLAAAESDLERVAALPGASAVEPTGEPGGGRRVRLRDPHGFRVDVVWGIEPVAALAVRPVVLNDGHQRERLGTLQRLERGPSRVKRLGHGVLMTTDVARTLHWYRETLGFLCSDDIYAGDPGNVIGSFNRCDRGAEYVDHHVFFAIHGPRDGLNHVAFEVHGFDDLMVGHEVLAGRSYEHVWGIGRHVLGSQVFDYWKDPWGRIHEHWTDSDLLNASTPGNLLSVEEGLNSQWGHRAPPGITEHCTPGVPELAST